MIRLAFVLFLGFSSSAFAQDTVYELMANYHENITDVTYLKVDEQELKLDIYRLGDHIGEPPWMAYPEGKRPTLIYIHGGGWVALDKSVVMMKFLPYLEKGWTVVNVNYRQGVGTAPAAVVDCRCALNWVYENSEKYGFDTDRLVLSGASAGGHLSLITGMKNADHYESPCEINRELKVAAIVNWFGVSRLSAYQNPETGEHNIIWMKKGDDFEELNKGVSPIYYVNSDTPPIISIHGDKDSSVPYSHATELHAALNEAGLANELHTVIDGKHGGFTAKELSLCFEKIWAFLDTHVGN